MVKLRKKTVALLALAVCLAGALALDASAASRETELVEEFRNAFQTQTMPSLDESPWVPEAGDLIWKPRAPYETVTEENLQGRWVNRYWEDSGRTQVEEVLTINGNTGKIECRKNGEPYVVWNGTGDLYIEDRLEQGVCPAITLETFNEATSAWTQHCGIYIRWVKYDTFYDGGSLCKWYREEPEDLWNQYLYDTVTMESLQGLWYSQYHDSAGTYQDVLNIQGNRASLFETIDGRISETWNLEGPCELVMGEIISKRHVPELVIRGENGPAAGGSAGIYISRVDPNRFYDAGLKRWYVRVTEENFYLDDGEPSWEGNFPFTVYGGAVAKSENGYVFTHMDEEEGELILDEKTELVHPETMDGYVEGYTAMQWVEAQMQRDPSELALVGVYDADVTGNHIDRIYGLYWWD